mgnify:CR=1 FL=1
MGNIKSFDQFINEDNSSSSDLKSNLEDVYGRNVTALIGEVDTHGGNPFHQIFVQFEDGSEFKVDGEDMGTSEEYINGGRTAGKETSKDQDVVDTIISFIEDASEEDIENLIS